METHRIIEDIYNTSDEKMPTVSSTLIHEACMLLEDYAKKITNKADINTHRWILMNLLNVLYKDVFLLQTEDLEDVITSKPKELDESLSDRCYKCNNQISQPINLGNIDEAEKIRGLCLHCFIDTVKKGEWWEESWTRLKDEL